MRELNRSGGRGAIVAIIDTGVAYENRGRFRRSPDLEGVKIKGAHDFLSRDKHPEDRNGHGTHVASTVFEQTDNAHRRHRHRVRRNADADPRAQRPRPGR